jgi:RNA polymerase sigma factor (sigma-70 family)
MQRQLDEHFMQFIHTLEPVLAGHGPNTDALQAYQVNRLVKLEKDFRKALIRHDRGHDTYRAFIDQCKNILTARPFFRERDETFKAHISGALKARDHVALTRFGINWQFIEFVLKLGGWENDRQGRRLLALAEQIRELRHELVECNLPLAISQARTFFGRNQQSHLEYMDFNQIGAVGLMEAVDKFCGPYRKNFRAVCIGRMLGNFIEENSQTFVHFFPAERKVLYRVRKLLRTLPRDGSNIDYGEVQRRLNDVERKSDDKLTSLSDMLHILAASQTVSANAMSVDDAESEQQGNAIEQYPDDHGSRPDNLVEEAQIRYAVGDAIKTLPLVDQKLLRMRGVEL